MSKKATKIFIQHKITSYVRISKKIIWNKIMAQIQHFNHPVMLILG